jgi:tetratricopeptide (TPR) repeat protein
MLENWIPTKTVYRILLLCIIVLLIFYPAIDAEISLIDDLGMVNDLLNADSMRFWDFFIPRSAAGGYYRPLLGISQYIDKQFWSMNSTFMHLENILFHLLNAVLVYILTLKLSQRISFKIDSLLPFAASLVFALHPIATESVNWISGRTDIMACNFILVSAIFLFRYLDTRKKTDFVYSASSLLFSLFAKEVAFGYILAFPFLLSLPRHDAPRLNTSEESPDIKKRYNPFIIFLLFYSASVIIAMYAGSYWSVLLLGCCYLYYSIWPEIVNKPFNETIKERISTISFLTFVVLVTFTLFFVLRKIAFTSNIDRISNTFKLIFQDTNYAISIFLGSAGFYVKKFFLPLPLNFFILEINPLYDLIGIAVFLFFIWLVIRRNTLSVLSITGMCCVLPAFPFAFGTIAWTGYAERYIYVASAFWSVAFALYVARLCAEHNIQHKVKILVITSFLGLLLIMAFITYQRNLVWQTNMALISDTVAKNPKQKELRGLYMLAFIRAGDLKSAREQYKIASSLHSTKYLDNYDINMAGIELTEGNKAEAEVLLQKVLKSTRGKSTTALNFYIKFQESELRQANDSIAIRKIQDNVISLYSQYYQLNYDPFILYRLGQIYIARNDNLKAIDMFEQAAKAYPPGSMYGENSVKLVKNLKRKISLK